MPSHSSGLFQGVLPIAPSGLEPACEYVAAVLAFQAENGGPFLHSLELEYAARRLARAARQAGLPARALLTWLILATAAAFGGAAATGGLARQLSAWAWDEFAAGGATGIDATRDRSDAA